MKKIWVFLLLGVAACKGSCQPDQDEETATGPQATPKVVVPKLEDLPEAADDLAALMPADIDLYAHTDDLTLLRGAIERNQKLQGIFATEAWNDLITTGPLALLSSVTTTISSLAQAPAGEAVVDEMLEGPAMLGLICTDPLSTSRVLILKKLDTSQEVVAKALGWWLKADQEERVERTEVGDIVLYGLPTAGQTLHHYILNGVLALSNDRELLKTSAHLLDQKARSRSVKNSDELPDIGGPFSVVLHLAAYRDRQQDPPLALLGLQALALRFRVDSSQIESQLIPDRSWGPLHNSPYRIHGYVPRDTLIHVAFTSAQPLKVLDKFVERSSEALLSKNLGIRLGKELVPALTGEIFWTFGGFRSDRAEPWVDQTTGFKVKPNAQVYGPMSKIWKNLVAGELIEDRPDGVPNGRRGCAKSEREESFCFALHNDTLLLGDRESIDAALAAATGRTPALADLASVQQVLKANRDYALAMSIDLAGLSDNLSAFLLSIADSDQSENPSLIQRDVKQVLEPFFSALGELSGWGGALVVAEDGSARGSLRSL